MRCVKHGHRGGLRPRSCGKHKPHPGVRFRLPTCRNGRKDRPGSDERSRANGRRRLSKPRGVSTVNRNIWPVPPKIPIPAEDGASSSQHGHTGRSAVMSIGLSFSDRSARRQAARPFANPREWVAGRPYDLAAGRSKKSRPRRIEMGRRGSPIRRRLVASRREARCLVNGRRQVCNDRGRPVGVNPMMRERRTPGNIEWRGQRRVCQSG